ncbi:TPA: hypothetical protein EYN98_22965 [Candidatus Poribacteria bacterium]|nr:hypothetical protein [Candidatus Poribacteria bacterium]HIO75117.1 hypothetical protein [Candidatus Neomarinimicrobiota bacterium]HIA68844.1 hypothetical protein [Candidatus Poribacteria bacterium]HIB89711.1 hypothetical protein [Candidatus Poribacteria bacterium]HIB98524.1 hypothetical protein [Candidatus Poribacteria bacterium]
MKKAHIGFDLVIEDYTVFPEVTKKRELLGYRHNGDHGVPQRESFKKIDENTPPDQRKRTMDESLPLFVFERELGTRGHVAFRDYLNRHEDARIKIERRPKDLRKNKRARRDLWRFH